MTDPKAPDDPELEVTLDEYPLDQLDQLEDVFDAQLRLDIFIIDSGWETPAHHILKRSMPLIRTYLKDHNLYVLTPDKSMQALRSYPHLIGRDPILMVVDRLAQKLNNPHGYGARIHLGHIHDHERVDWLIKMFLRVVNTHLETLDIAYTFQQYNYKAGIKGAVDIIVESFEHH